MTSIDRPGSDGDVTYTYDPLGRVSTLTDGRSVQTAYQYDGYDHVIGENFTKSGSTTQSASWTHDQDGNVTDVTDPTGHTHYVYDELNRQSSEQRGTGPTKLYGYDTAGNLTSYDADGSGGDAPTTYSYDANNLATSVADPHLSGTITMAYDRHDRRKWIDFPMAGASGNDLIQRTKYEDSGLVDCVYSYRQGNPPPLDTSGEDSDDPKCPESTASGLVTFRHYNYDTTVTLDGIQLKVHTDHVYTMRDKGDVNTKYDYDPINRLTQATVGMNGTQLREFDYNYNRHSDLISKNISGANPDLTEKGWTYFGYDAGDELCASATTDFDSDDCSSAPYSANTYNYDNAGELTASSAGLDLMYNLLGQTDQVTAPGSSTPVSMDYSGVTQDRRTDASSTASTTSMTYGFKGIDTQTIDGHKYGFIRDPNGQLLAMVDETSSGVAPRYYLTDAEQSVIATMDAAGATWRYLYEPYGKEIRSWIDTTPAANTSTGSTPPDGSETTTSTPDTINPWRFDSGYLDQNTGLLKFGTRYYMPSLGRWTQTDPKAGNPRNPLSMNPYLFTDDDPANQVDTDGRLSAAAWIAIGGAGVATLGFGVLAVGGIAAVASVAGVSADLFGSVSFLGVETGTLDAVGVTGILGGSGISALGGITSIFTG